MLISESIIYIGRCCGWLSVELGPLHSLASYSKSNSDRDHFGSQHWKNERFYLEQTTVSIHYYFEINLQPLIPFTILCRAVNNLRLFY